jgi:hypothetical protein
MFSWIAVLICVMALVLVLDRPTLQDLDQRLAS